MKPNYNNSELYREIYICELPKKVIFSNYHKAVIAAVEAFPEILKEEKTTKRTIVAMRDAMQRVVEIRNRFYSNLQNDWRVVHG